MIVDIDCIQVDHEEVVNKVDDCQVAKIDDVDEVVERV